MDTHLFEQIGFDDHEYIKLLEKLISHVRQVQNSPETGLIPDEESC